jgi:signal transduction histidine kinase
MSRIKSKPVEERDDIKTMVQVGKISCNLLHDLINPITGLSLYLENFDFRSNPEDIQKTLYELQKSQREITDFIKLIQDTVHKPNQISKVNIAKSIEHALVLGRHKIISHNVVTNFKTNSDQIHIKMNKLQFYQLIMNL